MHVHVHAHVRMCGAHARSHAHAHAQQVEENRELFRSPVLLGGPTRRAFGLARRIDRDGGISKGTPVYIGMGEGTETQAKKV